MLVLVYTYYYTDRGLADVYKYFDDGKVIYDNMCLHPSATLKVMTGLGYNAADPDIKTVVANTHHFDKPGGVFESNHRLIIRFNAILCFFSYCNIYVHTLIFCFLSFMGLIALYRSLLPFFEEGLGRILIIPVFLVPSVLFWSSGLLKETLIIFFLGTLMFTAMKLLEMKNIITNLLLSALCIHFLYLSKPFVALSFILSFYVMSTFYFKGYMRIIALLVAMLGISWFLYAHQTFVCGMMASLISKRNEFTELGLKMKAGSLVDSRIYTSDCTLPLKLLPLGLYDMFMQPFIWSKGLLEKLFGTENLLVLLCSLCSLFMFKRPVNQKKQLVAFSTTFFLLNYALIGITVPIIGALVRYKVFGLIFYLILVICHVDLNKFIFYIKSKDTSNFILEKSKFLLFK